MVSVERFLLVSAVALAAERLILCAEPFRSPLQALGARASLHNEYGDMLSPPTWAGHSQYRAAALPGAAQGALRFKSRFAVAEDIPAMTPLPTFGLSLLAGLQARWTRRQLASDHRAGMWARAKARKSQRRYLRAHWRTLTLGALVMLAVTSAIEFVITDAFTRGLVLGVAVTGTFSAGAYWVLQVTGTAPTTMGDLAEQWTASELRRLQREGWAVVHHFSLRAWDIDHVLVGPGGAFAVETKWSAEPWVLEPPEPRVVRAAQQAASNARDLRMWAKFKAAGVRDVQPVLVLWGAGSVELAAGGPVRVNDVLVVPGRAAAAWRSSLQSAMLDAEQVNAAWRALEGHARSRDAHSPTVVPTSMAGLAVRGLVTALAAGLGFAVAAVMRRLIGSLWAWAAVCVLLVGAALPVLNVARARLPMLAWQAGVVGTLVMGGVLAALPHFI